MTVSAALGGLVIGLAGCADLEQPPEPSVVEAAMVPAGAGCKGLLNAVERVCPDTPACPVIERELVKHGCVSQVECPCAMPPESTWYYDTAVKGVYCSADVGRLSMCTPIGKAGGEICVANLGDASEMEVDPAVCDACRALLPQTAQVVGSAQLVEVYSCTEIDGL